MTSTGVVRPDDPRLTWAGAVSLQRAGEWVMPWRVPYADRLLYPEPLLERAAMPAGVRLAFHSDTTLVAGAVEPQPEAAPLDLCVGGQLVGTQELAGATSFRFEGLPWEDKLVELWLPQFGQFRLRSLALSAGASLAPVDDARPRWVTYGSSITQCRTAAGPTQTWPAIVARERGLSLTCLGYGGQCHLDPMVARMIRDLPAEHLSMCVGINIQGAASLSPRTFRSGIVGFVQIVRENHPDTPFVVMSPICSPPRETAPNAVGFSLTQMREEVAAAVDALRTHGDRHVHYVDGLRVFGPELAHLLPDQLHPSAEGYRVMAKTFLREAGDLLFT